MEQKNIGVGIASAEKYEGVYKVSSLGGVRGRIRVEGPYGSLTITIDDGTVTVSQAKDGADCVLKAFEVGDLEQIIRGDMNMVTAILRGRLRIEGDPMLALRVAGSMPEIGRSRSGQAPAQAGGQS